MTEKGKKTNKDQDESQDVESQPTPNREAKVLERTLADWARASKSPIFRQQLLDEDAAEQLENSQKETPAK